MNYIIHNGELYHYGVKGMKWGVIKKQQPETNLKRASRAVGKVSIGTGIGGAAAMIGSKIAGKKGYHEAANSLRRVGIEGLATSLESGAVSAGLGIADRAVRTKRAKNAASQNADAPKSEHISKDTPVSQAAQSNKSKKGKIVAASIVGGAAVSAAAVGTATALYWKKMKPFTDYMLGKQ